MEWTFCNFGGERPWWTCPHCGRRCAIVYARGPWPFMCRLCANLTGADLSAPEAIKDQQKSGGSLVALSLIGDVAVRGDQPPQAALTATSVGRVAPFAKNSTRHGSLDHWSEPAIAELEQMYARGIPAFSPMAP
jgi:hypothetical protein